MSFPTKSVEVEVDWRSLFWSRTGEYISEIIEWDDDDGSIVVKVYEWADRDGIVTAGTFKQYDSGTFEWEAKYTNPVPFDPGDDFTDLLLGCLSKVPFVSPYYIPGTIFVGWDSDTGSPIFRTGAGYVPEGMTTTDLTGVVDFTQRHKYKIIWENAVQYPATGRARLYIDDVLRATHTTDIPSMKASFMIMTSAYKADGEVRLYNFEEL